MHERLQGKELIPDIDAHERNSSRNTNSMLRYILRMKALRQEQWYDPTTIRSARLMQAANACGR